MNEKTLKHFHAQFQTFDDPQERVGNQCRDSLRCGRSWRAAGLDGFVVPPRRSLPERISGRRAKSGSPWLTGFTGSAGAAVILAECAVLFGRRPLYAPGPRPDRPQGVHDRASRRQNRRAAWIEANLKAGQKLGFDPWLHTVEGGRTARQGLLRRRGRSWSPPSPTRSMRPCRKPPGAAPMARSCRTICNSPASPPRKKLERIRAEIQEAQCRRALWSPIRHAVRLDVQHPRRRRFPHAAAARLRDHPGGRRAAFTSMRASSPGAARDALCRASRYQVGKDTFAQDLAAPWRRASGRPPRSGHRRPMPFSQAITAQWRQGLARPPIRSRS